MNKRLAEPINHFTYAIMNGAVGQMATLVALVTCDDPHAGVKPLVARLEADAERVKGNRPDNADMTRGDVAMLLEGAMTMFLEELQKRYEEGDSP